MLNKSFKLKFSNYDNVTLKAQKYFKRFTWAGYLVNVR